MEELRKWLSDLGEHYSIIDLEKLTKLYLGDNQLVSLPETIGKLEKLTSLGLGHNQLVSIPKTIGKLKKLTELYLWDNQLVSLPYSIINLTNTKIYIDDNPLTNNKLDDYLLVNSETILKKIDDFTYYKPLSVNTILTKDNLNDYLTIIDQTEYTIREEQAKKILTIMNIEFKDNIYQTIINLIANKQNKKLRIIYNNLENQSTIKGLLQNQLTKKEYNQEQRQNLQQLNNELTNKQKIKINNYEILM